MVARCICFVAMKDEELFGDVANGVQLNMAAVYSSTGNSAIDSCTITGSCMWMAAVDQIR